ncbi:MAG TPA: hypothetical protein ENG82_04695, partial [Bacteroidetes bacterium]|nr:hypothetical protein [Bacteroidota bacterium]
MIWRTFYIQGSWNYERMLNLGFVYCLMPIIKRLYTDPEGRKAFLKRHLQYFNAHPYFASFALGVVARLEEKGAAEKWTDFSSIDKFKMRISSSLGALGDRLFWGMIKPIIGVLGVFLTLLLGIVGPIFMIVGYNIPHIYLRYYGVMRGYKKGFDVISELSVRRYKKYFDNLGKLSLFAVGILGGFLLISAGKSGIQTSVLFILSGAITYFILIMRKSFYFAFILAVLLMFGMALI